jgi:hypothetical protein
MATLLNTHLVVGLTAEHQVINRQISGFQGGEYEDGCLQGGCAV